jgi:hypothetical protein
LTATIVMILLSPAVSMLAIAACSAQNPMLHEASMQMPTYTLPLSVISALPTLPTSTDRDSRRGLTTDRAFSMSVSSSIMESLHLPAKTFSLLLAHVWGGAS